LCSGELVTNPSFGGRVFGVVEKRSNEEMVGIATARIITVVTDQKALGYGANPCYVGQAMCSPVFVVNADSSIPFFVE